MDSTSSKNNYKEYLSIKKEEVFQYYYKKIVIKDDESKSSITHIEWFSRTTKRNREYNTNDEDTMNEINKEKSKKQKNI